MATHWNLISNTRGFKSRLLFACDSNPYFWHKKMNPNFNLFTGSAQVHLGGENRIWTCDTFRYTRFPSEHIRPLWHLSAFGREILYQKRRNKASVLGCIRKKSAERGICGVLSGEFHARKPSRSLPDSNEKAEAIGARLVARAEGEREKPSESSKKSKKTCIFAW